MCQQFSEEHSLWLKHAAVTPRFRFSALTHGASVSNAEDEK